MADIDVRGEQVERALWARPLLWYAVRPLQQIMLVVVADPAQREHDDLLFCTDLTIPPELVASLYAGRWSIEDTFRNTKQLRARVGGEDSSPSDMLHGTSGAVPAWLPGVRAALGGGGPSSWR